MGYGTGQTSCNPCKQCHSNASASGNGCPPGSVEDGLKCFCNADYFGDGMNCTRCRICSKNATTLNSCTGLHIEDTVICTCNVGFFGTGVSCAPCQAGHYSTSPGI
jgi:hypothetical protein